MLRLLQIVTALLLSLSMLSASAGEPGRLALIIDDLGDNFARGKAALELPGPVTYSILPQTPYARRLATMAHEGGKEVMLHQPMASQLGNNLGPGGLTLHMTHEEFRKTLQTNIDAVPYVKGINNHMGSLLTRHPGHMAWLMEELRHHGGLYFVDSRTTSKSVALQIASEYGLPSLSRSVFIDHSAEPLEIAKQLVRLTQLAQRFGDVVAIGHTYPETVAVLKHWLEHLDILGLELVPVSALMNEQPQRSDRLWRASLSPSQKVSKNSKP